MSVNPTEIGIMSIHNNWIVSAETTITAAMTNVTKPTTEGDRTMAVTDIAMTTIEQTMITTGATTTGMTSTNHVIHETIGVTLIEVRETIDDTMKIVTASLLHPNRVGPFPTLNRGTTHPTNGLTPHLYESPRTAPTLPYRTIEERQAT